jgi:sec-independent protein translocase protein TatC
MPWSWRSTPHNDDGTMTLVEHLYELRNRLIKGVIFIIIGGIVAWFFYDNILHVLSKPYCNIPASHRSLPDGSNQCDLVYFSPVDGFFIRIKVTIIAGVVLASPLWLYQLWAFITPGLKKNERKYALSFVGFSTALFVCGAVLAYFVLNKAMTILVDQAGEGTSALLAVPNYLSFVIALLLIFGAAFEFPLLVVMLNMVGILTFERLKKWQRYIIFLVFCFSAVATPTGDPFTMCAMAVPMCLLFEIAVIFAWRHDKRKAARQSKEFFHDIPDDEASPLDTTPAPIDREDAKS